MPEGFLSLSLELQVALGGGYLAHAVAYSGLRKSTGATELALRSLAFGIIALLAFRTTSDAGCPNWAAALIGVVSAAFAGGLWRKWGMRYSVKILSALRVSREDGIPDAWTALTQNTSLNVTQLSVHTKDGRILHHDRDAYGDAWKDGLYFGSDGSIVMVVESEDIPGMEEPEQRQAIDAPPYGIRLTFIPADQISRINLRTPTTS